MLESVLIKWVLGVLVSLVALFAPVQSLMLVTGSLIALDMVTGVWAALRRKERITSRRMSRTLGKTLVYQLAVISGFAIELGLQGALPVSKLIMAVIALVEGKSLMENLNSISGKDVFKGVIDKLTQQKKESQ